MIIKLGISFLFGLISAVAMGAGTWMAWRGHIKRGTCLWFAGLLLLLSSVFLWL